MYLLAILPCIKETRLKWWKQDGMNSGLYSTRIILVLYWFSFCIKYCCNFCYFKINQFNRITGGSLGSCDSD